MSDPNVTVTPAVPVAVNIEPGKAPVAPPGVVAAPPSPTPAPSESDKDPQWLGARLDRERKKILADLGVEDVEDGKKSIAELKAKREAEKTAAQKATELEGKLKTTAAEKEAMAEALGTYAKAQMATLSAEQRAAVTALAGEDAAKQLKAIEALTPTWKAAGSPAASTTAVTPAPVADTAPRANAPNAPTTSPPDPKAIHAELQKTNPVIAARYALANGVFDSK